MEQLREDVWSIPVPIPDNPLRYVSTYALAVPVGVGLIDAGWESDAGWKTLTDGLQHIGATLGDVRGVLVAHMHFDHIGLASRIREAAGAWVAMHPADAAIIRRWNAREAAAAIAAQVDFLVSWDVAQPEEMDLFTQVAEPDRLLEDGDIAELVKFSV